VQGVGGWLLGGVSSSSGAQNAERTWDLVLAPGTWTFELLHTVGPDRTISTNALGPVVTAGIGVEVAAVPSSNAAWLGTVVDHNGQLDAMAGRGHQGIPGASDLAGFVNLLTTPIRGFTNPGALTFTDVTDAQGNADATEISFTAGSSVYAYVTTTPTVGRPTFLEFDLKPGSSTPQPTVEVTVSYDSGGAIHAKRVPIPPISGWARYRVPLKFATVAANILVQFLGPALGNLQIGRVRLYHASEPVNVDGGIAGGLDLGEQPGDLAVPGANRVRIYAKDNGAGKTILVARFATGAVQQIAIEP
jgi:hypothetical protein